MKSFFSFSFLDRYHSFVTCYDPYSGTSCLSGEAVCVENVADIVVKDQLHNVEHTLRLTKSCSCQLLADSFFRPFV